MNDCIIVAGVNVRDAPVEFCFFHCTTAPTTSSTFLSSTSSFFSSDGACFVLRSLARSGWSWLASVERVFKGMLDSSARETR